MTKKDMGLAAVSGVVLLVALYFMYTLLFPAQKSSTTASTASSKVAATTITGNIDDTTLTKIKSYKDYGGAPLSDIGRVNPFGPLN